jgi:CheY-like chemotaxis protein
MKDKHMNSHGFFKPTRLYGMEVPRPVADFICDLSSPKSNFRSVGHVWCDRMKSRAIETLQCQVEDLNRQFELANRARLHLQAANHDLRQPLHALGLFVAQLRGLVSEVEQKRIVEQIDAAVSALNERFNELLDHSNVDAAALNSNRKDEVADSPAPVCASIDRANGKLIVVIDDDPLVLDSTCGLLRSWGCRVVTGDSGSSALAALAAQRQPPDLVISDFRLSDGKTGIEAIAGLRNAFPKPIPAFLVSGDTSPGPLNEARASGFHLLHKPVDPMTLRAMLNRVLKKNQLTDAC